LTKFLLSANINQERESIFMKKKQSSASAAGVALLRAIESGKPESERICYDPYAEAMIPGGIAFKLSKWIITSGFYERIAPGAVAFVAVRERYIDDYLKTCLKEGFTQIVILGAGFDTRAYRITGMENTRVFEVDQPATQEVKLERLKKVIDPPPANVSYVPVDFNTQELGESLNHAGYDEKSKTLFIWQGVTYFLIGEGVDGTLSFVVRHSGAGSAVIFDYFYNQILRDPHRADAKRLRQAARISGEEYTFGIDQGETEQFLMRRGFNEICNRSLEELKQIYFRGSNGSRVVPDGIAIVSARTPE
jgi:methyltransferase (TIGR00027 family)